MEPHQPLGSYSRIVGHFTNTDKLTGMITQSHQTFGWTTRYTHRLTMIEIIGSLLGQVHLWPVQQPAVTRQ